VTGDNIRQQKTIVKGNSRWYTRPTELTRRIHMRKRLSAMRYRLLAIAAILVCLAAILAPAQSTSCCSACFKRWQQC